MKECLSLENYEKFELQGAKKVISATAGQVAIETENKTVVVTGSNLEVTKLDLDNHVVWINGSINNLKFSLSGTKKPTLLKRIFK